MEQEKITKIEDVGRIMKRRRWGMILSTLAVFLLSVLVVVVWEPVYRSTSTMLIQEQEIPREYVMSTVSTFAEQRLQAINQRIMSSSKLLDIIKQFDLYADKRNRMSTEEIIENMRTKDIKFETITADVVDPRTGRPTQATIAFSISYEGKNPLVVQQVDNALASLYLEENIKVVSQQTEGATKFLEEEMRSVQNSLVALERRIAEYKQRNNSALPELLQFNLQTLDWSERNSGQFKDQLRSLKERESYLQTQLATMSPDATNQDKDRLKELRIALGSLKARYSGEYPDVIKTKTEIDELEKKLQAGENRAGSGADKPDNPAYVALASELASVQSEIKSYKQQIEDLDQKRAEYQKRLRMSPMVEEGYKNLLVERNSTQAKYDDLMKKYMEARVAHGLEKEQMGDRFTLIDPARLPEKPVRPNRPVILLIGLILGMGSGIGTVSLQEAMDHSARRPEDLTRTFPLPVLAEVPEIVTLEDAMRRRNRLKIIFGSVFILLVVSVLAVHFFVMDLDVLWARVIRHLAL